MRIRILRQVPGHGAVYRSYEVETVPGMTVLDALFQVHDRQDDSLSFRYSCRGAVCGSCAVLINNVPRLACRTQIVELVDEEPTMLDTSLSRIGQEEWDPRTEALIEPLPNMPVIKDLVVETEDFFANYRRIGPTLRSDLAGERESRMEPGKVEELERYTNCIMCAACYGACPIAGSDSRYLGPAALAKLYRLSIDPRDRTGRMRLERADEPHGWWACRFYANCKRVCPKDVPPNIAIGKARQELLKQRNEGTEGRE